MYSNFILSDSFVIFGKIPFKLPVVWQERFSWLSPQVTHIRLFLLHGFNKFNFWWINVSETVCRKKTITCKRTCLLSWGEKPKIFRGFYEITGRNLQINERDYQSVHTWWLLWHNNLIYLRRCLIRGSAFSLSLTILKTSSLAQILLILNVKLIKVLTKRNRNIYSNLANTSRQIEYFFLVDQHRLLDSNDCETL